MYNSPTEHSVNINGDWLEYEDAVKEAAIREDQYELLEALLEAAREKTVPDSVPRAIKALVAKMF